METSYPPAAINDMVRYILRNDKPLKGANYWRTSRRTFMIFILCLLRVLRDIDALSTRATPSERREFLWYLFAEPTWTRFSELCKLFDLSNNGTSGETCGHFRTILQTHLQTAENKHSQSDMAPLYAEFSKEWTEFSKTLCCLGEKAEGEEVLLFVWDEATTFVKTNLDGQRAKYDEEHSKFDSLIDTIAKIGQLKSRMFSLVTDTTSNLDEFQGPRILHALLKDPTHRKFFSPIVNIPTYDYYANTSLDVTIDPRHVSDPQRLLRFGRMAWYALYSGLEGSSRLEVNEILAIAERKLTKLSRIGIAKLFDAQTAGKEISPPILALLGCRLGLRMSPYHKVSRELVASNLMTIQKHDKGTDELIAHYPSEPILAEVSARITAEKGWDRFLEQLHFSLTHGIVDKGYRGEASTKVLLLNAIELCRKRTLNSDAIGFPQSEPVKLDHFLYYYLNTPMRNRNKTSKSLLPPTLPQQTLPQPNSP
jgi:hypothetical protein